MDVILFHDVKLSGAFVSLLHMKKIEELLQRVIEWLSRNINIVAATDNVVDDFASWRLLLFKRTTLKGIQHFL